MFGKVLVAGFRNWSLEAIGRDCSKGGGRQELQAVGAVRKLLRKGSPPPSGDQRRQLICHVTELLEEKKNMFLLLGNPLRTEEPKSLLGRVTYVRLNNTEDGKEVSGNLELKRNLPLIAIG